MSDNIAGRRMRRNATALALMGLSACIFQHKKQGADTVRPSPKPASTAAEPTATECSAPSAGGPCPLEPVVMTAMMPAMWWAAALERNQAPMTMAAIK